MKQNNQHRINTNIWGQLGSEKKNKIKHAYEHACMHYLKTAVVLNSSCFLQGPQTDGKQGVTPSCRQLAPISRLAGWLLSANRLDPMCAIVDALHHRSWSRRVGFLRGGRAGSRGTWTGSYPSQKQQARTTGWTWNPVIWHHTTTWSHAKIRSVGIPRISKVSQV